MAWQSLSVHAEASYAEALGDALLEQGALSVDMLDADADTPDEQAIFGEPGEPSATVWQHNLVSALFDEGIEIASRLATACARIGLPTVPPHSVSPVPDNDWVRLTQSQFEPIRISPRLQIVPTWHQAADNGCSVNIILDPGLAFGTGSHPTTRLCLRWLDAHICGGEHVLDYGCGSGILAIAAMKFGAASATGIDIDPQAVLSSQDNARANLVHASFALPDQTPPGQFDLVIANILTNPLRLLAPILAAATRPGGRLVLSGLLSEQIDEIVGIYGAWFDFIPASQEDGWACVSGTKR